MRHNRKENIYYERSKINASFFVVKNTLLCCLKRTKTNIYIASITIAHITHTSMKYNLVDSCCITFYFVIIKPNYNSTCSSVPNPMMVLSMLNHMDHTYSIIHCIFFYLNYLSLPIKYIIIGPIQLTRSLRGYSHI